MNWKEYITPKNIFIVLVAIYAVVCIERYFGNDDVQNDKIVQYEEGKQQMQTEINVLNNIIYEYELQIVKDNLTVDGFSNGELDSAWSAMFGSSR